MSIHPRAIVPPAQIPSDLGCGDGSAREMRIFAVWPWQFFQDLMRKLDSPLQIEATCRITRFVGTITYLAGLSFAVQTEGARDKELAFFRGRSTTASKPRTALITRKVDAA